LIYLHLTSVTVSGPSLYENAPLQGSLLVYAKSPGSRGIWPRQILSVGSSVDEFSVPYALTILSAIIPFTGILFVLRSGIPWEMLPQELGCGSGMTCWRFLRVDWATG
jgi:hypothetical protein